MSDLNAMSETIFALASGAGMAGVAVVRISGVGCRSILNGMCGGVPHARTARLSSIIHPNTEEIIDQALVLFFPSPASFTGEDVVEFHLHGGRAVIESCLVALAAVKNARLAGPGEFTRRAFENGKLDLTQVEGLADLISAQTEAQRRQALRVASGRIGVVFMAWRAQLVHCLAYLEADIDFVDEDDVPENLPDQVVASLEALRNEIRTHLDDPRQGEKLRDGYRVAIGGVPNVGKSSLLNALARRDAAIVSDIAGTTRDVVEVYLDLAGMPVILSDTAGLRDTADEIESIGVTRAQNAISTADLVVWLTDEHGKWPTEATDNFDSDALWVRNKVDLPRNKPRFDPDGKDILQISVQNGKGIEILLTLLTEKARESFGGGDSGLITRRRHREALEQCADYLTAGLDGLKKPSGLPELVAENIRLAARMLGRITGQIDVEDLLDAIFSSFCVGK
jgi:tRNA modification GTPase